MRSVYVTYPSATLHREGRVLVVRRERKKVAEVRLGDVDQLLLMGNIVCTPAALDLLLDSEVDTVFLTHSGRYRGRIVHGLSGNVRLRMAQVDHLRDDLRALELARAIVGGKIETMRGFLLRVGRRGGRTEEQTRSLRSMRACAERLATAATLDEARGCEGSATAAYFRCFDDFLLAEGFRFEGRTRRPPLDPVNALLSFGYTVLSNVVEAAVNVVGLDPYLGALHALEANRPSLVCDLVEELRVPVVDRLVVAALNKGAMRIDDFEDAGPGEPVIIRREAVTRFVGMLERRLRSKVLYRPLGSRLTFRGIIEQQARHLARVFLGADERYEPFVVR